jgi:hypothetical protein
VAVTGAAVDVVTGASVGTEMFLDDAALDTGGVGGANSSSNLVSFVFSDTTIAAATGAAADPVTGALVGFEKSDGAISYTGGVVGAGFTSLLISFVFSDTKIAAATGALADEVTGALVGFGMSSDGIFLSEASK